MKHLLKKLDEWLIRMICGCMGHIWSDWKHARTREIACDGIFVDEHQRVCNACEHTETMILNPRFGEGERI